MVDLETLDGMVIGGPDSGKRIARDANGRMPPMHKCPVMPPLHKMWPYVGDETETETYRLFRYNGHWLTSGPTAIVVFLPEDVKAEHALSYVINLAVKGQRDD